MSFAKAYVDAVEVLGRPKRRLKPIYPRGWKETSRAIAMLVLVGGRVFKSREWPAIALVLTKGTFVLGHTIPEAAFPTTPDLPRIFEGHQCVLHVGKEVRIMQDVSTNGTLVIPPSEGVKVSTMLISDKVRKRWDSPCPKTVHPGDIVLTMYAELLLVRS